MTGAVCSIMRGGGAKSLEALELETAAQPRTNYRKLDKGGYRAENP